LSGAAAGWPLVAKAQQPNGMPRVGVLMVFAETDPEGQARAKAFQQMFQDLGWTDGRNVRIEYRWITDPEHIRGSAAELVHLVPDVILVNSNPVLAALRRETRSIPIMFVQVTNPVGGGFVVSLAHPGGNITGSVSSSSRSAGNGWKLSRRSRPISKG
jgi:putative ABC transport system substrate-binding protein